MNNGENEAFSIAEDVIFNPELDGVEEFVNVITFGYPAEGTLRNSKYDFSFQLKK